jgi:hypothetical protein
VTVAVAGNVDEKDIAQFSKDRITMRFISGLLVTSAIGSSTMADSAR